MVNMNVGYVRPARSLTTLQAELNEVWPGRQPDLGFVTGYKSPDNFSGHNPNNLGIVMGYDIGTYVSGAIGESDGRALADYLRTDCNEKLQYLIHDMSAGAPRPMIAGNHTGWKWVDYAGPDPHSNHIHLSIVDLYWGDTTDVPASVYDSTSSWGIVSRFKPGVKPQTTTVTPITPEGFLMGLTNKQQTDIYNRIIRYLDAPIGVVPRKVANAVWATPVSRGGKNISALQELADAKTESIKTNTHPDGIDYEKLADAIVARLAAGTFKITGAK